MKVIWKFPLLVVDEQNIAMPRDARILTVGYSDDAPTLWALVDPYTSAEWRHFRVIGTGHEIPDVESLTYLGTAIDPRYRLIWHVWEVQRD